MIKLLLKHEGLTLSTVVLDKDNITIGRNSDCDVQLDDAAVSGEHAKISRAPNTYLEGHYDCYLEDLNSTNGTRVNNKKVSNHLLKNGDSIVIGVHEFVFDNGEPKSMETTAIYLPDDN